MKKPLIFLLIGFFVVGFLGVKGGYAKTENSEKITVLNPLGQPPALALVPMAPRLDTLDGKTIYIVDTNFPYTEPFFEEMLKLFKVKYPKTNWVLKKKIGTYSTNDPKLWAEIDEKGDGMITAIGH